MIEHERSYTFTVDGAQEFIKRHNLVLSNECEIIDYYFAKGLRLRDDSSKDTAYLVRKTGDKSKGYRVEEEEPISRQAAKLLTDRAELVVKKTRRKFDFGPELAVTIDFVNKPMRLAILEIEASSEVLCPIPIDITQRLFNEELIECPRSAYQLFKRKVGFAGGPSSGKTETAKGLSYELNTKFGANSFHVAEYATTFIQKYRRNPDLLDQFIMWHGQSSREQTAKTADIVVSDCPTFLTYIYAQLYNKSSFEDHIALFMSKMYKRCLFEVGQYTDIYLMQLLNYEENNVRYHTVSEAQDIEMRIRRFLDDHKIRYTAITYNDANRIVSDLFYLND